MPLSAIPFRLSPSLLARHFFLECDRFLRYRATPEPDRTASGIPEPQFDHSPLMRDVMDSGLVWEEEVVGKLLAGRVSVAPGTGPIRERRFDATATLGLLGAEAGGRFVYQGTLQTPAAFYHAFGLPAALVEFADCHPDLIEVRDDAGGRVLRVIDIKRGEAVLLVHRVQVLLYALTLESVLAAAGVPGTRVDLETGGVWLGDRPEYEPFDLPGLRPYVSHFLREDLPALLAAPADRAFWHFTYNCERCSYQDHCRGEMRAANDLSRLTNLTPHGKRHLWGAGVRSLPQLDQFLQRADADEQLGLCASLAGERQYLEGRLRALATGAPQLHGSSTALPKGENVAVFFTLQREPLGRTTYLAGLLVHTKPEHASAFSPPVQQKLFGGDGQPRPHVRVAERPDAVGAVQGEFVRLLHDCLADVHGYNRGRPWEQQLGLQVYTHTERDREQLVAILMAALNDPALAAPAMAMLLHFQCPELMLADEQPEPPVPYPVIVLQNALTKMVALPVEVSYTLPEALAALNSPFAFARSDYYHYPLGHGFRSEAVHALWHLGQSDRLRGLTREATSYLLATRALLWAVRQHAADQLFAWPPKFALPAPFAITDPTLSRLAFFTRYESVTQYLALREGRGEPQDTRERLGLVATLRAVTETEFEVVGGTGLELEEGGPPSWLLSRSTAAGRRAQLEFRDYGNRDKMYMKPSPHLALVSVAGVDEDANGPRRVRVRYATKFEMQPPAPGELVHLQPRYTDFNSDRVIAFLQQLDADGGGLFLPLVRDPASAARARALPAEVERHAASDEAGLGLTASQRDAYREVRRRRVVAVWGPPGTGKTHCLAAIVLGLARAHRACGQPFRVLVTAFTHAAIENLLRKIAALQGEHGTAAESAAIGKVKEWHGPPAGDAVKDDKVGNWLAANPVAVVGATVYACLKAIKKEQVATFDLVVVDEASQLRVAESAVPVALVAPTGRLILAGDDLQLPPIVQGEYPEPEPGEPLLHRSIFEAVRSRLPAGSPVVRKLLENRRMNDVLTSFAAGLLYGPDYKCFDGSVAARRAELAPDPTAGELCAACLDEAPLVVVVLEGVRAGKQNSTEAALVAECVVELRKRLLRGGKSPYPDDGEFFRTGTFVVSPHRAQIRAIRRELAARRDWTEPPFVDTVDKMQGQEADAVVISYGVSDPEYALAEAEFIYSVNRLNVAVTRARAKCIVFIPRPLLDSLPGVLENPAAERGLAFMRRLTEVAGQTEPGVVNICEGVRAVVYKAQQPL